MDSDEIDSKQTQVNAGKISIKKSLLISLLVLLILVSLVAVIFANSYMTLKSEQVTKSELKEIITKLESKISENQPSEQPIMQPEPVIVSLDNDPIIGNSDASITVVEFSDFQCPFCARFQIETFPLILEQYVDTGKVKFTYRDFPIQQSHPNAIPAAVASECAHEQNKYWEYQNELFEKQQIWSNVEVASAIINFKEFATRLNLNQEQFDSCLNSGKYIEEVMMDLNDGKSYGITGTPTFFIGNENTGFVKITGAQPFESFKNTIDSQINAEK